MEDICKEFSNQFKENFTVFHHELANLSKDNQTPSYKNYKERYFLFWSCYGHFPSVLCSPATLQFFHSFIFHGTPSENQILGRKPSPAHEEPAIKPGLTPCLSCSHLVLLSWTTLFLKPAPPDTVLIHGFLKHLFVYMCSVTHFMSGFQKEFEDL